MSRVLLSLAAVALVAALIVSRVTAQGGATLSAQDQLDIRQLIDAYPRMLDTCTNNGNDYADLYTDDATFGVSSAWGSGAKIWFRGREQLRAAGGGTKDGCRPRVGKPSYHLNINPVITPTADGAKATSTLLELTNDTNARGDIVHWEGGYEDTFAKTAKGWRFKSRVHVWSEVQWTDNPADMPARSLEKE